MGNGQSSQAGDRPESGHSKQNQQRYSPTSFSSSDAEQHKQQQLYSHSPHSASAAPHAMHVSPHVGQQHHQQGRLLVDIRGANLDRDTFAVWVERQPARRQRAAAAEAMEGSVMLLSSTVQALGGILVTVLTISKLLEELKLIRGMRRNNTSAPGSSGSSRSGKNRTASAGGSRDSTNPQHLGLPCHLVEQWHSCNLKQGLCGNCNSSTAGADIQAGKQSAWSAVAGLQNVKMLLQEVTVLPLLRPDLFCGVRAPPTAVLLYGPPGTGKTLLAKAVAAASGASFFPITGSSVLSKWYGESEQNVRQLFEEAAAAAPSVVFIDEVDSLLGKRSGVSADAPGGAGEASRRVTNEFLAYMDGISSTNSNGPGCSSSSRAGSDSLQQRCTSAAGRVVVIAATNAPWDLDEAALSRFSARLMVPLPDAAARATIMKAAMAGVAAAVDDSAFKKVAEQAEGLSGRDLVALCREASMRPMRELFGNKILEGEAPRHCQQQQLLIAAVTRALQQGGSSRKLRRGLERWKRQHRAATSWCDVGQIIAAGEQGARQLQSKAHQQVQLQGAMQQQQPQAPQTVSHGVQLLQSVAPVQDSSCAMQCQRTPAAQQFVPSLQHVECCHCQGCVKPSASKLSSGVDSTVMPPLQQQQQQQPNHACAAVSSSTPCSAATVCAACSVSEQEVSSPAHCRCSTSRAVLSSHPVAFTEAAANNLPCCEDGKRAGSIGKEPGSTYTGVVDACSGSKSAAKEATEKPGRDRAPARTWTLEELIALPADAVRPVTVEDLLAALKQVGSVENSYTSRFEEWAQQYGSGPGERAKGGEAWKWMPMYT